MWATIHDQVTWIRGGSASIKWDTKDPSVRRVSIFVLNDAWQPVTQVADSIANTGLFELYLIPWGFPQMHNYFIKMVVADEEGKNHETKKTHPPVFSSRFSITSPNN